MWRYNPLLTAPADLNHAPGFLQRCQQVSNAPAVLILGTGPKWAKWIGRLLQDTGIRYQQSTGPLAADGLLAVPSPPACELLAAPGWFATHLACSCRLLMHSCCQWALQGLQLQVIHRRVVQSPVATPATPSPSGAKWAKPRPEWPECECRRQSWRGFVSSPSKVCRSCGRNDSHPRAVLGVVG